MPLRRVVSLMLFLLLCLLNMEKHAEAGAQASGFAAMPTCRRRCGDVEVPFPFGFKDEDPRCFYKDPAGSFTLICNVSFTPPKVFLGGLEIIAISIQNAKMHTWGYMSYDCYNHTGPSKSFRAYMYMGAQTSTVSYTDNIFVVVGCDTKAYIRGLTRSEFVGDIPSATYTGGCMSSCGSLDDVDGDCSGIGCCQTSIPKNFRGYNINIGSSHNHSDVLNFNPCSYSFLVEKNNYTFKASDLRNMSTTRLFPTVLDWYVGNQSCEVAKKNHTSYACISNNSDCVNSTNGPGYVCRCSPGYEGNPYVPGGCEDIDECQYPGPCHQDASCTNKPGTYTCECRSGSFGDGHCSYFHQRCNFLMHDLGHFLKLVARRQSTLFVVVFGRADFDDVVHVTISNILFNIGNSRSQWAKTPQTTCNNTIITSLQFHVGFSLPQQDPCHLSPSKIRRKSKLYNSTSEIPDSIKLSKLMVRF